MKHPPKQIGIKHLDWVGLILVTDLPTYTKCLAMYLARFMNKDTDCAWPSQSRIQHELKMGRATVNKYLDLLESEGWICRQRGNATTNTRYFISFPQKIAKSISRLGSSGAELGSSGAELGSSGAELGVVREPNTNRQLNQQTNHNGYRFPEFWKEYPRHRRYQDSIQIWKRKKLDSLADKIIEDVRTRQSHDERWCNGFIPDPPTYLRQQRWEDEMDRPDGKYGEGGI